MGIFRKPDTDTQQAYEDGRRWGEADRKAGGFGKAPGSSRYVGERPEEETETWDRGYRDGSGW